MCLGVHGVRCAEVCSGVGCECGGGRLRCAVGWRCAAVWGCVKLFCVLTHHHRRHKQIER